MTLEIILEEIRALPIEERKQLITMIVDTLTDTTAEPRRRNLRQLRGLGKEIWAGVDPQDYINQQRDEWDKRP